jgi:hypothetical protein
MACFVAKDVNFFENAGFAPTSAYDFEWVAENRLDGYCPFVDSIPSESSGYGIREVTECDIPL